VTGVSREKLTAARKLRKADPEIAEKVEQGELSLDDAADKVGVVRKKRIKPSVAIPAKQVNVSKSAKGKPTANQSPWHDEFTELIDTPDGLRTLRCKNATFYSHKTEAFSAVVMPDDGGWWWYVGTEDDQDTNDHREDAEQSVRNWFSAS